MRYTSIFRTDSRAKPSPTSPDRRLDLARCGLAWLQSQGSSNWLEPGLCRTNRRPQPNAPPCGVRFSQPITEPRLLSRALCLIWKVPSRDPTLFTSFWDGRTRRKWFVWCFLANESLARNTSKWSLHSVDPRAKAPCGPMTRLWNSSRAS